MDGALGEGTDTAAAPLAAAAQEGVEAEAEGDEPGKGKEQARGEGEWHRLFAGYRAPFPGFPEALMRARSVRNFG